MKRVAVISRPRRLRVSNGMRSMVCETSLLPQHLIQPIFVHDQDQDVAIEAMPGQSRRTIDSACHFVQECEAVGIKGVILFPVVNDNLKTPCASESYNEQGLVPRAVRAIKNCCPTMMVLTDVALDPYNSDGQDGVVRDGYVANDATVEILCRQAVMQAEAGSDVIAPSDMMDGRVAAIRDALDKKGFQRVSIMSYAAKYASALYGPFRHALDSAPKGDKKTYQMDPRNAREAERECALDEAQGADILMIKPATLYLDILRRIRVQTTLPIAAYHVSGSYAMLKSAVKNGWANEEDLVRETLLSIRRAGADLIVTYCAYEYSRQLKP